MTTLREAAQQALEALEEYQEKGAPFMSCDAAADALRAALAEPQVWVCPDSAEHRYTKPGHCEDCGKTLVQVAEPVEEPVAWIEHGLIEAPDGLVWERGPVGHYTPLYTAPPQRKPLTEEEIWALYLPLDDFERSDRIDFARAIERAHEIGGDK